MSVHRDPMAWPAARSADTHPAAEAVQVELLRRAGARRRLEMVFSLSRETIELSRRALRRARPDASQRELDLEFVALAYGRDLAERLRQYLQENGR